MIRSLKVLNIKSSVLGDFVWYVLLYLLLLKGLLELLVRGVKQNITAITNEGVFVKDTNITLFRDDDESVTALFPSGISVTFANIVNTLAIAFNGPEEFKNRTRGLLGTWNDDPTDEFLDPFGTLIPADATPRQIHYDFGLKCE